ncbi:MAG: hypothetical protein KGK06_04260 [Xanthomonadaceae bacterium]|nr:hypothetical protein [Xanthomonadaceae bacterium]
MVIAAELLAAAALAAGPAATTGTAPQVMPTVYEAGHFYAVPETRDGQRLKLVVDTGGGGGGGLYWISGAAANRLHLQTRDCAAGGSHLTVAPLPDYRPGHALPPPDSDFCGAVVLVNPRGDVTPDDGQLGAGYLPGHVWTFDYPAERLTLQGSAWRPDPTAHPVPLGFPRDGDGRPTDGFARIVIRVDGQPLDMLLDTGATAHPTAAGKQASGIPTVNGYGVASYITRSVLERWHKAHPGWRVVDGGDDLLGSKPASRMIEVPDVEIGGWSVGPVWFTERPDRNFGIKGMSRYMDSAVTGAVGGNVFEHFVMTIDYPHATAWFRCVTGCKAVATPPPAP